MYPKSIPETVDPLMFERAWVQSRVFMIDIIKYLHTRLAHHSNLTKTCLDVGPHLLGGTTLLKELHSPDSFTRLKLTVSALDIDDKFESKCKQIAPDLEYIVGDLYEIDRVFDIVIASHVLEHVPDPISFCKALQKRSRDIVIVACPWREFPLTTQGHINTIDKTLTRAVGARDLEVFSNFSWGLDRECCLFWLPGLQD